MKKLSFLILSMLLNLQAFAESSCDIRPGFSVGIRVVEFASGNAIHSKIPMVETTAEALLEEMVNLQDMGICEEKIIARKCTLKFEKKSTRNYITMYRGQTKWNSWNLSAKNQVHDFVKRLKRAGFCS
ncbi:MAG: hypothetical protein NDI69_10525 [Bacteriovoracaceae bacterium]|nr:hypothetical protein [Bacteriovoracaceae bacterium]